jgi:hypothetical protein
MLRCVQIHCEGNNTLNAINTAEEETFDSSAVTSHQGEQVGCRAVIILSYKEIRRHKESFKGESLKPKKPPREMLPKMENHVKWYNSPWQQNKEHLSLNSVRGTDLVGI